MATLTSTKIKNTYDALLKASDNDAIGSSAKQITDGLGNSTPLYISTTQIGIGVTPESGLNLHVYGDAKIGSNLTVIGNLVVEGSTTTVGTDTLTVKDPLIVLANNNTSTDAVDIGFYGKYTPSGTTLYSGLFREALTGKYRLFKDLQTEPTTTVNTSGTGYAKADLIIGALEATTATFSGNISSTGSSISLSNATNPTITVTDTTNSHYLTLQALDGASKIDFLSSLIFEYGAGNTEILRLSSSGAEFSNGISGTTGTFSGNVDIDGTLDVDDVISVEGSGFGRIEVGGASGGYIDLKAPNSDDYDLRLITSTGGAELLSIDTLKFYTGTTTDLAFTIDASQNATFENNVTIPETPTADTHAASKGYVDAAVEGQDTLAEILANGNTTGGTSIDVGAGDDINLSDTSDIHIGDDDDLVIRHNGTNSFINNNTGQLNIYQLQDDGDIKFFSDDGAGGTENYFQIDGGEQNIKVFNTMRFSDDVQLRLGTGSDLRIYHDATDSIIGNTNGDLYIRNDQDDGDIIFQSDNGSGGRAEYLRIDGTSENIVASKDILGNLIGDLTGNVTATSVLADGVTATTQSDGDNSTKVATTAYVDSQVGANNELSEVLSNGNTTGGTDIAVSAGDDITFTDTSKAYFGTGNDLEIYHDGTNSYIEQATGNDLIITNTGAAEVEIKSNRKVNIFIDQNNDDTTNSFNILSNVSTYAADDVIFEVTQTGDVNIDGSVIADGNGTFNELTLTGGTDNLTITEASGDWTINNAQQNNGITIYDGTGGIDLIYNSNAKFTVDSAGVSVNAFNFTVDTDLLYVDAANNLIGISKTPSTYKLDVAGKIASDDYIIAGLGSGGVALTHNDGEGNANVTFNHVDGIPEQNGNSFRIRANTDSSSGATMRFEIKEGVTADTAVDTIEVFRLEPDGAKVRQAGGGSISLQRDDTSIVDGNPLGRLRFGGDDPTNDVFNKGAEIRAEAAGTWDTDNYPTELQFYTTATDTNELALTLDSSQNATFAGTVTAATYYKSSGTSAVLGTNASGEVLLRPTAWNLSTAQSSFTTTLATIGTDTTIAGNVTIGDNSASEIFLAFNSSSTDFALGANGSNFMIGTSSDLDTGNLITLSGANGRLGIGTTSPDTKLQVYGTSAVPSVSTTFQGGIFSIEGTSTVYLDMGTTGSPDYYAWMQAHDASNGVNYKLAINPLGGNVGIGTDSPDARFSVVTATANSTASRIGGLEYSGTQRGLTIKTFQSAGGDDCGVEFNAAEGLSGYGSFIFKADTAERMRINSSGNVGINGASNFGSDNKAIQLINGVYSGAFQIDSVGNVGLAQNAYQDGTWKYYQTNEAAILNLEDGQFKFFNAASGTADATITFSQRMHIANDGKVGIGLSSSLGYKLNVAGSVYASGDFIVDTFGDTYRIGADTFTTDQISGVMIRPADNANPSDGDSLLMVRSGGGSPRLFVEHSGRLGTSNNKFTIGASSSRADGNVVISSSGDTYFNGGDVGIGLTSPSVPLEVNGEIKSSTLGLGIVTDSSSNIKLHTHNSAAFSNVYHQFTTGTTGSAASDGVLMGIVNGYDFWIEQQENRDIAFHTNGSKRLTIYRDGNVGINVSLPQSKLHIGEAATIGTDFTTAVNNSQLFVHNVGANTNSNVIFAGGNTASTGGTGALSFGQNGQGYSHWVFYHKPISTNQSNVGSISTTSSATSYNTSSDYRLKENVVEMTGALDRVSQLKPSRFNFIEDADKTVDGFLAHEVQDIVPEAITGEKDAVDEEGNAIYQGIDQAKLVPLLVGAIQELKAEIEQLKTQINN